MCRSRGSHDAAPCRALCGPPTATLSTRRPLIPLALRMITQRRTATLRRSFGDASSVAESRAEMDVRIPEESLFERDDDELHAAEPCAAERADVLHVREVQCCVDLVQDVHRRGLESKRRHDRR